MEVPWGAPFAKWRSGWFDFHIFKTPIFESFGPEKHVDFISKPQEKKNVFESFDGQNSVICVSSNGPTWPLPGLPDPDLTCYTLLLDAVSWTFPLELLDLAQRRGRDISMF